MAEKYAVTSIPSVSSFLVMFPVFQPFFSSGFFSLVFFFNLIAPLTFTHSGKWVMSIILGWRGDVDMTISLKFYMV